MVESALYVLCSTYHILRHYQLVVLGYMILLQFYRIFIHFAADLINCILGAGPNLKLLALDTRYHFVVRAVPMNLAA